MKKTEQTVIVEHANKTVYREGDEIIKLFRKGHPKSDVFNEAVIHSYVEEAGIPVPELKGVSRIGDCWALTQEYVEGKTLEQMLQEKPRQYKKLIDKLIDIQLETMAHRVTKLRSTLTKMSERVDSLKDVIDPSTRYELQQRLNGMERHTKLCHGDFVPSNVIILKDGSYRILDWSHATKGNAGADAAITYLRFSLENQKYADYYIHSYCLKADTPIQYIQKWMPIVAANQLTKHVPEEEDLLMRWISVAEYM